MHSPADELEKLRFNIEKFVERFEETTDPAERTAMLPVLAAMRQKEILLMQGEGKHEENPGCMGT